MEKKMLSIAFWVLFLGGHFGIAAGMLAYLRGGAPFEYAPLGIGGGAFLVWSALVVLIKSKVS